ncbi:putative serine/threonine protein kinase [Westerdykella ornata]|uniref:Putative serine/threonine protein kinase n=1 Tax=Westerdykella ornata TaxID=318751 RepID=A0A6A6JSG2_WESOR|nr:putative serine/threonine protein kinase [Westerdykella ornata]KAF2277919.1 putative serine/threonine protein kinase [Westerdykella ornata]
MASVLKAGQYLRGKLGSYCLSEKLHEHAWTAIESKMGKVVVKTAPTYRLENERDVLKRFHGQPSIRPLLDEILEPPCLGLKYLDDHSLRASNQRQLEKSDVEFIARRILESLDALHSAGYVHTDIKPDNILVNYGSGPGRFSDVQLGDCGDAYRIPPNVNPKEDGELIGAAMFRSPEATLNLRWCTPTDVRSLGATLISLIWGKKFHIFKPAEFKPEDEEYLVHVFIKQISFFGPWHTRFQEIADEDRWAKCIPFILVEDEEVTTEDKVFLCKLMKLDPRDRPSAKELLEDEWLRES